MFQPQSLQRWPEVLLSFCIRDKYTVWKQKFRTESEAWKQMITIRNCYSSLMFRELFTIRATIPSPACPVCGSGLEGRQSTNMSQFAATWRNKFKGYWSEFYINAAIKYLLQTYILTPESKRVLAVSREPVSSVTLLLLSSHVWVYPCWKKAEISELW